jgi:glucokinase
MPLLGVDIGGTKISVCLGDKSGKVFHSERILTQPLKGAKRGIPAIFTLVRKVLKETGKSISDIDAIGISSPGPISSKKGKMLTPPNLKGWENTALVKLFEEEFAKPVFMNNDANAAVLAEYEFGSSKKTANMVYLTVSTGMGGGVILNGKLLQGATDTAAEVGHYVLEMNGPLCPCGLRGCFEVYCGGANLAKKMREEIREKRIASQILTEAGGNPQNIEVVHLVEAVKKGDPYAQKIWDEFIQRLAQGIGVVLMCYNPDAIILGTIAIHAQHLLLDPLKKALPAYAWKEPISCCKIEASKLGDKISELSALALAINGLKGNS